MVLTSLPSQGRFFHECRNDELLANCICQECPVAVLSLHSECNQVAVEKATTHMQARQAQTLQSVRTGTRPGRGKLPHPCMRTLGLLMMARTGTRP